MTKLHGAHGKKTAGGKHKAGKKHEEEVEDVEEEEWEDAEDEDGPEGVALDVSSLKAIIDQLAAQQGVVAGPAAAGMPTIGGEEKVHLINSIRPAVVVINQYRPVAIGEEERVSTTATGFIVDKARGILLTNRHVRHIGPCRSEAVLYDKSIVPLEPIYVDPIHDFGFFKFETREDLGEIELCPQEAIPGSEIFVVGNNSAEALMILPSVLARVDRDCPQYDMNTFYCTGANNTSGGSSGSPVLNRAGKAIALNSGGKVDTAVSYFLPLDGVLFALRKIQAGEPVPRADLFAAWKHVSYDEAKRLSLPDKYVNEMKNSKSNKHNGLLVVDNVLRDCKERFPGKSHRLLVGDILLKVNGQFVSDHWTLETILGQHVDKEVTLEVYRAKGLHTLHCKTNNLDYANPTKIFVYNASSFHEMTYNTAMDNGIVRGKRVFMAEAGSMFAFSTMSKGLVIQSVNNVDVRDLDHFIELIRGLGATGGKAKLCSLGPDEFETNIYDVVHFDSKYYGAPLLWKRDLVTCDWSYDELQGFESHQGSVTATTNSKLPHQPVTINFAKTGLGGAIQSIFTDVSFREFTCTVEYSQPVWLRANPTKVIQQLLGGGDGKPDFFVGLGVVLDRALGYILTNRSVAPDTFGDVRVRFHGCESVFANTVFVHPVYNFSIVHYNVDDVKLKDAKIRNATFLRDSLHNVYTGKTGVFYSMGDDGSIALPASPAAVTQTCLTGGEVEMQYFPAKGTDMFSIGDKAAGLFTDDRSHVLGLSDSFYGACDYLDFLHEIIKDGEIVREMTICPIKLCYKPLEEMITFGVDKKIMERYEHFFQQAHFKDDSPVFVAVMKAPQQYKDRIDSGDMILELNDKPVFRVNDIHSVAAKSSSFTLKYFRMKTNTIETVTLQTRRVPTVNFSRFVTWCGINIRNVDDHDFDQFLYIHDADEEEEPLTGSEVERGLVINGTFGGTPAEIFGVPPYAVLLAIDHTRVRTFEDFFQVVRGIPDNTSVTLKVLDASGQTAVVYLVTDYKNTTTLNRWFDETTNDWKTQVFHHK